MPSARAENAPTPKTATLVLGAGCFWCVEAVFEQQPGVLDVVSGYAGGTEKNPTYKQVGSGSTSHAEVVKITFDPAQTSLAKLLELFWHMHDPTNPRGVWPDFGQQYRSLLLYQDEAQKAAILASRDQAQKGFEKQIATEISPLGAFYDAEDYHQDYAKRNPDDRYIQNILVPKLKKLGLKLP
jgi:peptide-methionine (S)-S-oxide reductase